MVRTIQNYDDGTVDEMDTDQDVTVDYAYSAGRLVTMTAYNAKGDDSDPNNENVEAQATKYLYESDVNASWQTAAVYPDSTDVLSQNATTKVWTITTDNGDHVSTDYDRLGRVAATMDQRAVEHEYVFDSAGRLSADTVTSLGSSGIVDDAILRIGTTYDDLGRVETVTSYSDIYGTTVVNQVEYVYNGWGQVAQEYQEHDGPVDGNSLFVQYDYADGAVGTAAKYVRLDQVTYPNGREVHYDYGATGAIDDIMSRLATIKDDDDSTVLASYKYLGAGRIVTEDYEDIDVKLDYSANNFAALDRFGRVVDQLWLDYGADPDVPLDEYRYGYDRAGNRVWKENVVSGNLGTPVHLDELYAYDAIDRLTSTERGNLIDGQDGKEIDGTPDFTQDWDLDGRGNWSEFDDDGTSQTRTANAANEITAIDSSADDVAHDAAGNMTRAPKLDGSGEHFHVKYDAWNRLVAVCDDDGATLVSAYQYDGAGRRIVKGVDDDADGLLDTFTHFLHRGNQVIETREGDDVSGEAPAAESLEPKYQNVWSPRYIDSMVLRDEYDAQGQIIAANRLYYLADANYNVTALLDASGNVVERYVYTAYGKATILDSDFSADADNLSDVDNTTLYTGRELDVATGLYYYRARYYHTELGRFFTRDPIGFAGGDANLYRYCANGPMNGVDPSGLSLLDPPRHLRAGKAHVKTLPDGSQVWRYEIWSEDGWIWTTKTPIKTIEITVRPGDNQDYDQMVLDLRDGLQSAWEMDQFGDALEETLVVAVAIETHLVTRLVTGQFDLQPDAAGNPNEILGSDPGGLAGQEPSAPHIPDGPWPEPTPPSAPSAQAPGSYLAGKAPGQVTPGTRVLQGQHVNDLGRVEPWTAHYDQYGRLIGRTDFNAANRAAGIPDTHCHTFEWGPGKNPLETGSHLPGEFKP